MLTASIWRPKSYRRAIALLLREVYKLHEACKCILVIQQERVEVRVDLRTDSGWSEQTLTNLDDMLTLADFGLSCSVSDVYRGTPLAPHQRPSS